MSQGLDMSQGTFPPIVHVRKTKIQISLRIHKSDQSLPVHSVAS